MPRLEVIENKILKLSNLVVKEISIEEANSIDKIVIIMDNYIRSKGANPIGPLIQFTKAEYDENGKVNIKMKLARQANNAIDSIEKPYKFMKAFKTNKCLFVRFIGDEQNIHYAYDKLNVYAFEEDIKLKGTNYTVFAKEEDERMTVDIFMELDN